MHAVGEQERGARRNQFVDMGELDEHPQQGEAEQEDEGADDGVSAKQHCRVARP